MYCEGLMEVHRWESNLVNTIKDVADDIAEYVSQHNLEKKEKVNA